MKKWIFVLLGLVVLIAVPKMVMDRFRPQTFTFTSPTTHVSSNEASAAEPSTVLEPEDWPQWRGAARDGKAASTGLLDRWPETGPPLAWKAEGLGRGMSSVTIASGRLFTLGKQDDEQVHLIARHAETGEPIWSTPLGEDGDPNGSPTVDGQRVYAITYNGVLVCADVETGAIIWRKDFVKDFGAKIPQWGFSESPLVDGDSLVCTPGAEEALFVAFNKSSGGVLWKTKTPTEMTGHGHAGAGYSSIVISHAAGVRQYVQLTGYGVLGIAPDTGQPLWGYTRIANSVANIPTPIVHQDYVFTSTGYGTGSALLKLVRSPEGLRAEEIYFHAGKEMQNHHGGMVLVDGHVYFGHGHNLGLPVCVEMETGQKKWGPVRGPGAESAAVVYADGHLYFRYQNAIMALIEATPEAYRLKSSFKLPSQLAESWPHPVIAHGRLYLRDQQVLLCYDLRKP